MGWLIWSYCQLFCLQLLLLLLLHPLSCYANLCPHDQSSALLQFKQLFSHEISVVSLFTCSKRRFPSYQKMKNWEEDTDCCSWAGVTCDMVTGDVIGLDLSCSLLQLQGSIPSNSSLFLLPHLRNLDLSFNDFNFSRIPSDFSLLSNLTRLDLSSSFFSGQVPSEISRLSKLISLDISHNLYLRLETPVVEGLVQNLTGLEELFLDFTDMSTVVPSSLTNLSSSLTSLSLESCELKGSFPENIFHLPNLQLLNLRGNSQLAGSFPKVNWSNALSVLDVYSAGFSGALPYSIGNLKSLRYLLLSYNNFSGNIPSSLSNLKQLIVLDLSRNNFIGQIPDIFTNLTHLSSLDFSDNQLVGPIPSDVSGLQNLTTIKFSGNSLNGTIPTGLFTLPLLADMDLSYNQLTSLDDEFQSNSLQSIDLSYNRLCGSIPSSIFKLVNLYKLELSSNNLSGTLDPYTFTKLKSLKLLNISHNSLSLITAVEFDTTLEEILRNQNNLRVLDLSDNKIHGQVPNWVWEMGKSSLYFLDLSHNFLTGIQQLIQMEDLTYLDLSYNLLQGSLPVPPPLLIFFSASHNNLTGVIPPSFCNLSSIEYLDLSDNSLYGKVPQCLGNSTTIVVLDMRTNYFHGSLPQIFGRHNKLTTLNLNGNKLEGPLPPSVMNCDRLQVLDLGNNMINDTFPHWLAALPELEVLILRSNRFHGPIGNHETKFPFSKLRILDLSHNKFSGLLPTTSFKNFQAMMSGESNRVGMVYMGDSYYHDSVELTIKGVEITMERILTIFTTMDFSSNQFEGQIPDAVGKLNSLKILNFSRNYLTGSIPSSLKNLTELESLDLSWNELDGKIPTELTSLTYLSALNLSYNHLRGLIPQGKQFNTFQNHSYFGNMELCGLPLSEKCSNSSSKDVRPEPAPSTSFYEEWFDWKIIMMGYACGLVIGLSTGYITLSTGKPQWISSLVQRKKSKRVTRLNVRVWSKRVTRLNGQRRRI
ncbi:hypothetical protein ACOSQ4_021908 [Xanthoceras sorbifolium]